MAASHTTEVTAAHATEVTATEVTATPTEVGASHVSEPSAVTEGTGSYRSMRKPRPCKPTPNRPMAVEVVEVVEIVEVVEVVKAAAESKSEKRPTKSEIGVTVTVVRISVWIRISGVPIIRTRPLRISRRLVVVIGCLTVDSCRLLWQCMHQPGSGRFVITGPSAGRLVGCHIRL